MPENQNFSCTSYNFDVPLQQLKDVTIHPSYLHYLQFYLYPIRPIITLLPVAFKP